jgi:hypothetical protein
MSLGSALSLTCRRPHHTDNDGAAGVLYHPVFNSSNSQTAVYVIQAEGGYMTSSACREPPRRGFVTFCANSAADKSGVMSSICFEDELVQADLAMQYICNLTDNAKVVLFGHSGWRAGLGDERQRTRSYS